MTQAALLDQDAFDGRDDVALDRRLRRPLIWGLMTAVIGIGGFVAWAFATPISSASISQGRIVVDSRTKTVTHASGGILAQLLVAEGDHVMAGAPLLRLDNKQALTRLEQLSDLKLALGVRIARLRAEVSGEVDWTYATVGLSPEQTQIVANEISVFRERQRSLSDQIALRQNLQGQYETERASLEEQLASLEGQLTLLAAERERIDSLVTSKLGSASDLAQVRLTYEQTQKQILAASQAMVQAAQKSDQVKLEIATLRSDRGKESSEALQSAQSQLSDTQAELLAVSDVLEKSEIRSPQDGIVANLRFFTEGSSIPANQPILDIVPQQRPLLVEVHVRAVDIDTVKVGQRAEVHLNAFGTDALEPLFGEVNYVEANSQVDPASGGTFYVARASIDTQEAPDVSVFPGMTADVYLVNGSKRAIDYLIEPFLRGMQRTFREQ